VVGNGSIFEPKDVVTMLDQTGCDSVMVARGALGNPFIFSRYNSMVEKGYDPGEPNVNDVSKIAIKHFRMLIEEFGEINGINSSKKFIIWYFKKFDGIYNFIENIIQLNNKNLIEECISDHSDKISTDFYQKENLTEIEEKFKEKVLFWVSNAN
jgi:tRNA-dihydrouridine synthase B